MATGTTNIRNADDAENLRGPGPGGRGTMTRKQVAQFLNLSIPTIVKLERREENPLPGIRIGKKVIYPATLVNEWLDAEVRRQAETD